MLERTLQIYVKDFALWLLFGLPGTVLWCMGGYGAIRLLFEVIRGGVIPGVGSTAFGLTLMWGTVVVCAIAGIAIATAPLYVPIKRRFLVANTIAGFCSLFFSLYTVS